jgi:hypothetical protein
MNFIGSMGALATCQSALAINCGAIDIRVATEVDPFLWTAKPDWG